MPQNIPTLKEYELYVYLVASVLLHQHQPTLLTLAQYMQTNCDAVVKMLSRLEEFELIDHTLKGGLYVTITENGPSISLDESAG